ncbi:MAG: hypothetical protein ACC682_10645 [Gemmatimonadota bacterium]
MRSWRKFPILLALLTGASAGSLDAQVGPIIDWITRLHGPGFVRVGAQFTTSVTGVDGPLELSVAGMYGFKSKDGSGPDGAADATMLSLQGTLDVRVVRVSKTLDLLAIGGIAGHSFSGDQFDSFGALSFPLQGVVRFKTGGTSQFRLGAGWNIFRFGDDAFDPIDVGVDRGTWEAVFGVHAVYIIDF